MKPYSSFVFGDMLLTYSLNDRGTMQGNMMILQELKQV